MYQFWGKVKSGKKRGKELGFPTANLLLHKPLPEGIYISKTKIANTMYPSLTFIGKAITFAENTFQAETYLLSYNKNLYNTWISVQLLQKIRDNKKFSNEEELIEAMQNDLEKAQHYFNVTH